MLYGVSSISQKGWNDPVVLSTIILGIIFVVLFIWRQERLETPLLSFKVFKNSQFTVGIAIMAVTMISMIGSKRYYLCLYKMCCNVRLLIPV